jgi:Clostripain family
MENIDSRTNRSQDRPSYEPTSPFDPQFMLRVFASLEKSAGEKKYLAQHNFDSRHIKPPAPMPPGKGSWTVYVDLSANFLLNNGALQIDNELQQQKLIDMTRDKPIKIIVQTTLNHDPELNKLASVHHAIPDAPQTVQPQNTSVVRYEISNGQKHLLSSGTSKGISADLTALLTADPNAMKADHVALFSQAHGANMGGLTGDSGSFKLPEFKSVVEQALKKQGRTNLDLLDLAACNMSSAQAIPELSAIAKFIVSSEEEQYYLHDGADERLSPISKPITQLIAQTEMQPQELGQHIIQMNADICNANTQRRFAKSPASVSVCAANTLGLYDASAAPELTQSLNQLGSALTASLASEQNKSAIEQITQRLPKVYDDVTISAVNELPEDQQKDLGMFLEGLEDIKDTAGSDIHRAVIAVRAAMDKLVVTNFNSTSLGLGLPDALKLRGHPDRPLSGLSVFLPTSLSINANKYGQQHRRFLESQFDHDQVKFELDLSENHINNSYAAGFRNDLSLESERLGTLSPYLKSPQTRQEIDRFQESTGKLLTWMESAHTVSQPERRTQYLDLKLEFSANLKALIDDTKAWDEIGMAAAERRKANSFNYAISANQPEWNQFVEWMGSH